MCGCGGGAAGGDQTTQVQKPPKWWERQAKGTLNLAQDVANRPYQAYRGQTVAGLNPYQMQAFDYVKNQMGMTPEMMRSFIPGMQGLSGFNPEQVQAGQFAGSDMSAYMNPYTQNVVDTSMANLERQRQGMIAQGQAQAGQAGAYGGSRHGVADSLTNEAALRQAAETGAGLYSQGYDQAAQLRMGDIENQLRANLANQQAGIQGAGVRMEAGRLGSLIAQQAGQAGLADAAALQQSGNAIQGQTQAQLDDRYRRFLELRDYPEHQLQIMMQALMGTPAQGGITRSIGPGGNPYMGALGGAAMGAGIGSGFGPFGTGLGGVLGGLAGGLGGLF